MQTRAKRKKVLETLDDGQVRGRLSRTRLWLIDVDDTLFEASAGMFAAIHERMERFIADKLDLSVEEAARVQNDYWREYGATYLGLERHHGIAPEEFFNATHRFNLEDYIHGRVLGERLRRTILSLPGKKVVLTNGPACYAERVLQLLKLEGVVVDVVSADRMRRLGKWRCKPDAVLFSSVCAQFGVRPELTTLIEDSPDNLRCAKALGMNTVWCAGYRKKPPHFTHAHPWADWVVSDLGDLKHKFVRARSGAFPE